MEQGDQRKHVGVPGMSTAMPHDWSTPSGMAAIREFFGSSQLSQFMDRPPALGDTHKRVFPRWGRRLSREPLI